MRFLLACFVVLSLIVSLASAELLVTANPIGKGKWAVEGLGVQDSNFGNVSGYKNTSYGAFVGYGLTEGLDLLASYALYSCSGLPAGIEVAGNMYGLVLKQTVVTEGENLPVSVAAGLSYKPFQTNTKIAGVTTKTDGAKRAIALGVSKIMAPFIPYGALAYSGTSLGALNSTAFDITLGTAIAWSTQGAVFVEYTNQAISDAGVNYTSAQIAAAVGYKL